MIDPETGEHHENNSEMADEAARDALDDARDRGERGRPDDPGDRHAGLPAAADGQPGAGAARARALRDAGDPLRRRGLACRRSTSPAATSRTGSHKTAVVIGSEAISPAAGRRSSSARTPTASACATACRSTCSATARAPWCCRRARTASAASSAAAMARIGGDAQARHPVDRRRHARADRTSRSRRKRFVELQVDVVDSGDFTPLHGHRGAHRALQRSGVDAEDDRPLPDPRGQRRLDARGAREAGLLTPEWVALEGKIFDNLAHDRRRRLRRRAALPRRRPGAAGAIKQGDRVHADRRRGHEVDLRGHRPELDRTDPAAGRWYDAIDGPAA